MRKLFVAMLIVSLTGVGAAFADSISCGGYTASPDDWYPDDDALQCLLNAGGEIWIPSTLYGPGYIIDKGLHIVQPYTSFGGAPVGYGWKAVLVASNTLGQAFILDTPPGGVDNVSILFLEFDGNKYNRAYQSLCPGRPPYTGSVLLRGNNTYVSYSKFYRTMCGAALFVEGNNFTVENNEFSDNGFGRDTNPTLGAWSDGIRSDVCNNSYIQYNTLYDTTDVGVSLPNVTNNCVVTNNNFIQTSRWAFAAAGFPNGTHNGSQITNNTIEGNGRLSFGLAIGARPWGNTGTVYGGTVSGNTVSGARVNLNAEDIGTTYIGENNLSNFYNGANCTPGGQGTNCNVYNAPGVTQAGCVFLATFDGCIP